MRTLLIVIVATLALAGCAGKEEASSGGALDTIAPAQPQPAQTGTEALTQTVDIESGRSENEGGGLTTPNPPVTVPGTAAPATQTTTTAGTTATTNT